MSAAVLLPGFAGTELPGWLEERLRAGLAGVCLFGTNVAELEQLRRLTAAIRAANPRAIIAIDEEGGDVTRLYERRGSPYPGNAVLGRIDDPESTALVARTVGWELRRAGVNLDFAPDIDINSNPDNPVIGTRSFGAEPELVARHSAAWVRGLQGTGVAASAKHFPGHGDTAVDSHLALPVVDLPLAELRERELRPFAAAIAAGSRTIMTSHILLPRLDPARPATFSPRILLELLRGELGFDGVIVSDALNMRGASGELGIPQAAVLAIAGGCDLLCIGTDNSAAQIDEIAAALQRAVSTGALDPARLADAGSRVAALATELAAAIENIPIPEYESTEDGPVLDLPPLATTFEVLGALPDLRGHRLIAVETAANIAVGPSPWGLAAAGAPVLSIREGEGVPLDRPLIIVGKDNHRHAWVRALVDEARLRHPSTVVIDMGWPGTDRRYADVATFGASRSIGLALGAWLDEASKTGRADA